MKNQYKNILSACLLMCLALSATAQVEQIFVPENNQESDVTPQIKIEDNQLLVITSSGVYSQDIDKTGNLLGENLLPSELFKDFEYEIRNIAINGDIAFVTTTNYFQDKNSILKTTDGGNTWIDLDTWEGLEFADYYNQRSTIHRGISQTEELIALVGPYIYHSSDFGETWKEKGICMFLYSKVHPSDSGIIIGGSKNLWIDVLENCSFNITYDYGQSWDYISVNGISGFYEVIDVAYHYADPNNIVLNGGQIAVSKDKGQTWEATKKLGYNDVHLYISNTDFDTRGSDRLYGTRNNILLYSDDFGANWTELCTVGEDASDYIANFVQREHKVYVITSEFKVYQIDLSQLETSIDAISADNNNAMLSIAGDVLKVNAQTPVTNIEVYGISGIKLLSQEYTSEGIDISDLARGTYVARLLTADGRPISIKFNK